MAALARVRGDARTHNGVIVMMLLPPPSPNAAALKVQPGKLDYDDYRRYYYYYERTDSRARSSSLATSCHLRVLLINCKVKVSVSARLVSKLNDDDDDEQRRQKQQQQQQINDHFFFFELQQQQQQEQA